LSRTTTSAYYVGGKDADAVTCVLAETDDDAIAAAAADASIVAIRSAVSCKIMSSAFTRGSISDVSLVKIMKFSLFSSQRLSPSRA
jgi:hypothetical protein